MRRISSVAAARRVVTAAVLSLVVVAVQGVGPLEVAASTPIRQAEAPRDTCNYTSDTCPVTLSVLPHRVDVSRAAQRLQLIGTGLRGVRSAFLEPEGQALAIVVAGPRSAEVTIPMGTAPGEHWVELVNPDDKIAVDLPPHFTVGPLDTAPAPAAHDRSLPPAPVAVATPVPAPTAAPTHRPVAEGAAARAEAQPGSRSGIPLGMLGGAALLALAAAALAWRRRRRRLVVGARPPIWRRLTGRRVRRRDIEARMRRI